MTTIIDGKALAKKINAQTKELVAQLKEKQNIIPGIAVVIAGDDAASLIYTRNKHNKAIKLGINSVLKKFPADVSQDELLAEIEKLNNDDTIDAILVQQPLPPQLDPEVITNAILQKVVKMECIISMRRMRILISLCRWTNTIQG